jgi:2-oxoglutarate ferredoxin oxidoreductase subunit alpha
MNKAFYLAAKFQVPVFVLTDQYFLDTYGLVKNLDVNEINNEPFIVETDRDYKRYKIVKNGISPRGIPGNGYGFVMVDSDEHDEQGRIYEDPENRKKMNDKRSLKMESIKKELIDNVFDGNSNYKTLIISWGSTYNSIKEALNIIKDPKISHLHFQQLYPLGDNVKNYLSKAENLILIENNFTGQLGKLLRVETGVVIENKILKYDGYNFYVEELVEEIKKYL